MVCLCQGQSRWTIAFSDIFNFEAVSQQHQSGPQNYMLFFIFFDNAQTICYNPKAFRSEYSIQIYAYA